MDDEKIINFKSCPEFYEKEKDGRKPNTERFFDGADNTKRKQRLERNEPYLIRITNTKTGESFLRRITDISRWEDIWIISWDATEQARASAVIEWLERDGAKAFSDAQEDVFKENGGRAFLQDVMKKIVAKLREKKED